MNLERMLEEALMVPLGKMLEEVLSHMTVAMARAVVYEINESNVSLRMFSMILNSSMQEMKQNSPQSEY